MEIYECIVFFAVFIRHVISHSPFAGCMRENTYGYGYLQFFHVSELSEAHGGEPLDPNARLYLEFYVRASQNAHILLSKEANGKEGIEILLGGGSNTFSQIRRLKMKGRKSVTTVSMGKTVTDSEDRGFWIELDSSDYILVGRKGETSPFLYAYLNIPFPINYFSFSTWTNVKGVWHFACPKNPGPGLDEDEKNVTTIRLRDDLFSYYNRYNFPENEGNSSQTIQLYLEATTLFLDEKRGELELNGVATLKWKDWKLVWNPNDYDNLTTIHVHPFLLWTPNLKILNSATFEKTSFLIKSGSVLINNSGDVTWRAQFRSVTFCIMGYKKWPYDRHNCTLVIGFSTEPLKLNINTMKLTTTLMSRWEIQNPEENGTVTYLDEERDGVAQFHIQRRNPSAIVRYYIVPPFLSAAILTLLSFWVNPESVVKLFLCCGSVFILITTIIILGDTLPYALSPETVCFYHLSVFIYCFPVLFFIGLKYLPNSINVPRHTADFLNSRLNEILLCFPKEPQVQQGKFSTREEVEQANNAFLLGVLYERLIFFVYFIFFLISFLIALFFLEIML